MSIEPPNDSPRCRCVYVGETPDPRGGSHPTFSAAFWCPIHNPTGPKEYDPAEPNRTEQTVFGADASWPEDTGYAE